MSFAIPVAKRRMRHGVRMERRGADHPSAHERRLRVHRARVSTPTLFVRFGALWLALLAALTGLGFLAFLSRGEGFPALATLALAVGIAIGAVRMFWASVPVTDSRPVMSRVVLDSAGVRVGGRRIAWGDIASVEVERRWLGCRVVVHTRDGGSKRIIGRLTQTSAEEVVGEIMALVPEEPVDDAAQLAARAELDRLMGASRASVAETPGDT